MVWQDDPHADPRLLASGCAFFSAVWFASLLTGRSTTIFEMNERFHRLIRLGILTPDAYVQDWHRLFEFLGIRVELVSRSPDFIPDVARKEFEILLWGNPRTGFKHFTAGDGSGRCTYDPLRASITVAEGRVIEKRVFLYRGNT